MVLNFPLGNSDLLPQFKNQGMKTKVSKESKHFKNKIFILMQKTVLKDKFKLHQENNN